jgi:hypothetical protein
MVSFVFRDYYFEFIAQGTNLDMLASIAVVKTTTKEITVKVIVFSS